MRKKLVKFAIAVTLLVSVTTPVWATSICDVPTTTFEIWLIKKFSC